MIALVVQAVVLSARLLGTTRVGHAVSGAAGLSFRPADSNASVVAGVFVPDVVGDYLTGGGGKWRAVVWPAAGHPPPSIGTFRDGFSARRAEDSDSVEAAYRPLGTHGCNVSKGGGGLRLQGRGKGECGLRTVDREVPLLSPFEAPVTVVLGGLWVGGGVLELRLGPLVASVRRAPGGTGVAADVRPAAGGPAVAVADVRCGRTAAEGATLRLGAGAANLSLELECTGPTRPAPTPHFFVGPGIPHGLSCPASRRQARCGGGAVTVSVTDGGVGGAAGLAVAASLGGAVGADPLRPTMAVPALPAVLWPLTDEVGGAWEPSLGEAQPLATDGLLDVTKPPFLADPTGRRDSTSALQAAVDWARAHYCAVFLPSGTFLLNDTLLLRGSPRAMATGHVPGPLPRGGATDDFLLDGVSSRYVPSFVVGDAKGKGAVLQLPPNTQGFGNPQAPKVLVDTFFLNAINRPEPNAMYNTVIVGVTVRIGDNNPGAVGVRLRGAQGSGLENVTVHAGDGLAGIVGGCGSGGAHHGITVHGGRYGLDLREAQPASTISGVTLVGQRCGAIVFSGFETLTAVGVRMVGQRGCSAVMSTLNADVTFEPGGPGDCRLPPMPTSSLHPEDGQKNNAGIAGKMVFVDSSATFQDGDGACARGRTFFSSNSTLVLQRVYLEGPADVLSGSPHFGAAPEGRVLKVTRAVRGVDPPPGPDAFQIYNPVYQNGVRSPNPDASVASLLPAGATAPSELVTAHQWPEDLPSWQSPDCINARRPPHRVAGDGKTDDWAGIQALLDAHRCVFLPRGVYLVSRTLQVMPGGALIGLAKHLTRLVAADGGLGQARHPSPGSPTVRAVVEMLPGRSPVARGSTLAFISLTAMNNHSNTSGHHVSTDCPMDHSIGRAHCCRCLLLKAHIKSKTKTKISDRTP